MKKILPFLILIFGIYIISNAQVVELTGVGVLNDDPVTLNFTDTGSIDSIMVEAAGIFRDNVVPQKVTFNDDSVAFMLAENDYSPVVTNGAAQHWGYYQKTFKSSSDWTAGITLDKNDQGTQIVSFYAYVFRSGGTPEVYTAVNYNHTFFYQNGSGNPYVYHFTIPASSSARDIELLVPFSELTEDGRYVMGTLSAGGVSESFEFDSNNQGELLNIQDFVLHDVPGNVTDVSLSIYSPILSLDGKVGDSFLTSSVLLTTTVFNEGGCTYTYGYWKTHSEYGPASKPDPTWDILGGPDTPFFLSGQSYYEVLNTKVKGNAYYILAHQYIAAELNMLTGADFSDAYDAFMAAKTLFETYTPAEIGAMKGNDPIRKDFENYATILDDYNNGIIGPGHCDDEVYMDSSLKSAQINPINGFTELTVYPNPVTNIATITFTPKFDGKATINLYNSLGQKASVLFNNIVSKDVTESFTFERQNLSNGLYFMVLQNGNDMQRMKIMVK